MSKNEQKPLAMSDELTREILDTVHSHGTHDYMIAAIIDKVLREAQKVILDLGSLAQSCDGWEEDAVSRSVRNCSSWFLHKLEHGEGSGDGRPLPPYKVPGL